MCELMGMCFDQPVAAEVSIRAFGLRAVRNADGWGLGWYPDRSLALVKEPIAWDSSSHSRFLESYNEVRAPIFIAHVRHRTTGGPPSRVDTHPFAREWQGREYCFAHNGTLNDFSTQLSLDRFHPVGGTDSEHLFCWLLGRLAEGNNRLQTPDQWAALKRLLRQANELGRLNCLLSDGQRLFAYRDVRQWKGLSYSDAPISAATAMHQLEDATVKVEIMAPAVTRGIIVATAPLNEHPWHAIPPGDLIVIENGEVKEDWPQPTAR
jgi:predicted glutamine amidotransferase